MTDYSHDPDVKASAAQLASPVEQLAAFRTALDLIEIHGELDADELLEAAMDDLDERGTFLVLCAMIGITQGTVEGADELLEREPGEWLAEMRASVDGMAAQFPEVD